MHSFRYSPTDPASLYKDLAEKAECSDPTTLQLQPILSA